jgi:hypothetical protein
MAERFRVSNPNVMSETIDGEVIIINLATGTYYSLKDVGAEIWSLVDGGATAEDISASLASRYEAPSSAILDAVGAFLADLANEELVAAMSDENGAARADDIRVVENGSDRAPFRAPALEKYTDMQELILLDPVHEVGAAGWPHRPTEGAA